MTISENVTLIKCPEFGEFDKEIVAMLLRMVQENFYRWLGGKPDNEKFCLIYYRDNYPEICSISDGLHLIKLNTHNNLWCQWVYQFAHEFCHHLINGSMSRDITGLMWFEETVCELASLHNLYEIVRFCKTSSKENLNRHVPAVLDYPDDLMKCSIPSIDVQGFLARHIDVLNRPVYCQDTYNILASSIFPLFLENPCLWKIILHFGDMRRWTSLEALSRHLRNTADDSYSLSLYKLQNLLVGQFPAPSSGAVP